MLKLKEKARVAFEMESAKARLSKLNNTVPQPVATFKPGQLIMSKSRARLVVHGLVQSVCCFKKVIQFGWLLGRL